MSSLYHLLEPEIVQCLFQFAQPRLQGDALYFLLDSEKYCSSEMERADSCPRKVSLIKSLPELCCVSGSPTVLFGYVYRPIPPQCSPYMGFLADKLLLSVLGWWILNIINMLDLMHDESMFASGSSGHGRLVSLQQLLAIHYSGSNPDLSWFPDICC